MTASTIGLLTSHNDSTLNTTTFTDVAINAVISSTPTPAATLAPAPLGSWTNADIGNVGDTDGVGYANSVFTARGASTDIWVT